MDCGRLTAAAVLFLWCVAAGGAAAQEEGKRSHTVTKPYISKEVLVLLEEDLAVLADRISSGRLVTYSTEEVAYPLLREIAEAQRLSTKMGLMLIQQNNEIIRLLEQLVEQGR